MNRGMRKLMFAINELHMLKQTAHMRSLLEHMPLVLEIIESGLFQSAKCTCLDQVLRMHAVYAGACADKFSHAIFHISSWTLYNRDDLLKANKINLF